MLKVDARAVSGIERRDLALLLGRLAAGHVGAHGFAFSRRGNGFARITRAIGWHASVYGYSLILRKQLVHLEWPRGV